MEPIHLSLSGVLSYKLCARQYGFKVRRRLRVKAAPNDQMVSGRVVDDTLTKMLKEQLSAPYIPELVEHFLSQEFAGDTAKINKFKPGAMNAVSKCPSWIMQHRDWHVQEPLDCKIDLFQFDPTQPSGGCYVVQPVIVHGRPDIWRMDESGDITLLDFKTTDNDPLEYLLWEPQLRYYAVGLRDLYPDSLVWFRYITLSTQGKKVDEGQPIPFGHRAEAAARQDLTAQVKWIVEHDNPIDTPNYSRMVCRFCDFNKICTAIITGGDPEGVIAEDYEVRERRGN